MHIRIGTRTSLMAMAQAKMVAAELSAKHPSLTYEFVGIVPIGDKDKKTPLWQMGTVGVFSKEIDDQLLAGAVDITVHSFKDLGTQRPEGIVTGALLPRENERDIMLFRADIYDKLKTGQDIFIGTSAPRRTELLPDFLARALPQLHHTRPRIHVVPLRGNANTRITRLQNPAADETPLDGIVLALAGLGRLFRDDAAHAELKRITQGLRYMIMPLTVCPAAPGQGTVCIETLDSRDDMKQLLASIHHKPTADVIAAERHVLVAHGGGCHQKFGATCLQLPALDAPITIIAGKTKDDRDITEIQWQAPAPANVNNLWTPASDAVFMRTPASASLPANTTACFVAHSKALPDGVLPNGDAQQTRIYVSGPDSWYKLAARGYWIEGCADGFGFDFITPTLAEPFLNLPALDKWTVLTSDTAVSSWEGSGVPMQNVIASTKQTPAPSSDAIAALQQADAVWWPSLASYDALAAHTGHIKLHCCGVGKTAGALQTRGIAPLVFPNLAACQAWAAQSPAKRNGTHD